MEKLEALTSPLLFIIISKISTSALIEAKYTQRTLVRSICTSSTTNFRRKFNHSRQQKNIPRTQCHHNPGSVLRLFLLKNFSNGFFPFRGIVLTFQKS